MHDKGHTPYSHELEEITNLNQMEAAKKIIQEKSFSKVLIACDIDPKILGSFFDTKNPNPHRKIVSDKVLGTDKLSYLFRDGIATGKGGYYNIEAILKNTVFSNGILGIDERVKEYVISQIELYQSTYASTYFSKEARLSQRIFTLLGQTALELGVLPDNWTELNDLWYDYFNIRAEEGGCEPLKKLGSQGIVKNDYRCISSLRMPNAEMLEEDEGQYIGTINEDDYTEFLRKVPVIELKKIEERLCKVAGVEPLDILIAPGGRMSKLKVDDVYVFKKGLDSPLLLLRDRYPEKEAQLKEYAKREGVSIRFFTRKECWSVVSPQSEKLVDEFKKIIL